MTTNNRHSFQTTIEEFGPLAVDVTIHCFRYPAEPPILYYPDGSGYPGHPAYSEFDHAEANTAHGETYTTQRCQHPDWFQLLDVLATRFIEQHWDRFQEDAFED